MKRAIIIAVPVVALAVAGGGWTLSRSLARDPLAQAHALLKKGDIRGAQLELRNAVRSNPSNAEAHYELGLTQLQLGDPVAAEKELKSARAAGWKADDIVSPLAEAYLRQARYRDLLQEFTTAGLPAPIAAKTGTERAYAELALKNMDAAAQEAAQAEKLDPKSAGAAIAAAKVALARRDPAAAMQQADLAVQLAPKDVNAWVLRSQIKLAQGNRDGALDDIEAAVAASPDDVQARLLRAALLLDQTKKDSGKADIDFVLAHQPRNPQGILLKGVLLTQQQHWAEADAEFEKIGLYAAELPEAPYFIAMTKLALNQPQTAAEMIGKYLARNPNSIRGLALRGRIALDLKNYIAAANDLQRVVATKEGATPASYDLLGRAYALSGRPALARQSFQTAAQLAPGDAAILDHLASAQLQTGNAEQANATFARALAAGPDQTFASDGMVESAILAGDLDGAQAALDKLAQKAGNTEKVGVYGATIKMARYDLAGAKAQLEDVLRRFPDFEPARLRLAQVAGLQGDQTQQKAMLEQVLARDPANAAALTGLVQILAASNDVGGAEKLVDAAARAKPADAGILSLGAALDIKAGHPQAALDRIQQADPQLRAQPATLAVLAQAQLAAKQTDAAIATYRQIVAANPNDSTTRRVLAEQMAANNDVTGARVVLQDGLGARPGDPALLNSLIALDLRSGGLDAALATADKLAHDPANGTAAHQLRGNAYMMARRPADAAAAYQAEAKAAPSAALALATANAFAAAGQPDRATPVLQAWLAKEPDDAAMRQALGGLQIAQGKLADAEQNLQQVLAKNPSSIVALNNLAWIYQQQHNPQAETLARRAYLLSPSAETADTLGWIMANSGNPAEAVPLLRQAHTANPQDPRMAYHLAYALNGTGQANAALDILKPLMAQKVAWDGRDDAQKLLTQLAASR